jgi:hypothetical protein
MLLKSTSYEAPHYVVLLQPSIISSLLGQNIPSAPCSETPCVCFSLNVRDQVSHPYKTAGCVVSNLESVERFVIPSALVSALGSQINVFQHITVVLILLETSNVTL